MKQLDTVIDRMVFISPVRHIAPTKVVRSGSILERRTLNGPYALETNVNLVQAFVCRVEFSDPLSVEGFGFSWFDTEPRMDGRNFR